MIVRLIIPSILLAMSTVVAQGQSDQAAPASTMQNWVEVLVRLTPLVAIVAAIVGVSGAFLLQWWRRRNERRDLAAALAGEISAIRRLVHLRDFYGVIRSAIEEVRHSGSFAPFSISITENYFEVFSGNVDRLGLLPGELPERISFLYTMFKGVVEDLRTISHGGHSSGEPAEIIAALEGINALLIGVLALANTAVQDLSRVSRRPAPRLD